MSERKGRMPRHYTLKISDNKDCYAAHTYLSKILHNLDSALEQFNTIVDYNNGSKIYDDNQMQDLNLQYFILKDINHILTIYRNELIAAAFPYRQDYFKRD